jgi:predicted ester cyclase
MFKRASFMLKKYGGGSQVAIRFLARGTHTGQWLQFSPSGRSIEYTGLTLARIGEDKIIEHDTWWDNAGLMEQLGNEDETRWREER